MNSQVTADMSSGWGHYEQFGNHVPPRSSSGTGGGGAAVEGSAWGSDPLSRTGGRKIPVSPRVVGNPSWQSTPANGEPLWCTWWTEGPAQRYGAGPRHTGWTG